jgi:chemotaxis protein MotB
MNSTDIKVTDLYQSEAFNFPELCEFDPAEEKDSSWLISFVDILSLLITLFVLLLSFSHMARHAASQNVPIAPAGQSPVLQPVAAPKTTAPAPLPPVLKAMPTLSIPQNIKNMVDVVATATEINLVIKDDVLFAEGSADLTALGRSVLDGIAQILKQSNYPVSVEGHTDNVPIHTAQFPSNWELSSFRATNVARYFIRSGVSSERLRAIGYADTHPVAANDSEAGRALNRRVSLVIQVKDPSDTSRLAGLPLSSASP